MSTLSMSQLSRPPVASCLLSSRFVRSSFAIFYVGGRFGHTLFDEEEDLVLWGRFAMAQPATPIRPEANEPERSHSPSFDHRRRPETLRTAMAMAFFCPTRTTSRLPRVTPV
jgi:hypothetical protein